jgi:hypothetical protein
MRGSKWITVMMMEMVLILMMMLMERPPPMPRRRGGEDGGDFPFSGASKRQDLTLLEGGRGFAGAMTSVNLKKNRVTPFFGETKAWLKGVVETGPEVNG